MLQAIDTRLKTITREQMIFAQRNDPNLAPTITKCLNDSKMELINELLYLIKEDGKQLLVIPWDLIESVLSIYHNDALAVIFREIVCTTI